MFIHGDQCLWSNYHNFAGLLGCNFMGNWFVALRLQFISWLYVHGVVNFCVRVTYEIQKHWFPRNNDDSIEN